MDLLLKDKLALITGSTKGIGFATAKSLAREGARVIINGRDKEIVKRKVLEIQESTGNLNIEGIVADLSSKEGCEKVLSQYKEVDILINNLGIFEPVEFSKTTDEQWYEMFDTNVLSGVRLTRGYLDSMLEKDWGRVIFISSESAFQIPKEMIHYGMTKTAQISIARGVAELTKGSNVTCNSVILGPSTSEGVSEFISAIAKQQNKSFDEMEEEFFTNIRPTSLLQRFTKPEEIANLITYTASPLSSATNGAVLRADAGVVQSAF